MPQDVIASNYQRNLDEKDRQVLTYQQNLQLAVEKVKGVHSLLFKIMLFFDIFLYESRKLTSSNIRFFILFRSNNINMFK